MRLLDRASSADAGLLLQALIWGVNFSVMKLVLDELSPLVLNALRFPLAAAALAMIAAWRAGMPRPRREDVPRIVLLGLLGHVAYQLCFIYGMDATQAGNASLLLSTTPVWTMILSAMAGHERASPMASAGVVGTLLGMSMVVIGGGGAVSIGWETIRGDALMVVGAVLWSVYTVAGRDAVTRYGALNMTTWTVWVGTPVLVALGLPGVVRLGIGNVSPGAWMGVAYAGFLSIGLAYLLWYRGVQRLGNNRTAVYSNLVPVTAMATAWLWLGEVPTLLQAIGAVVILLGLTIARLAQSPGPISPSPVGDELS